MNHLSGMDAMFLHVESAEMPMHIGSLHVLDLPAGYDHGKGEYFDDVMRHVQQRLHLAGVFTRKLALMPFDLSNPVWVDDEDIDLEHHVRHLSLPKPGSNRQLQALVARLHSSLLDRSRPLWELFVIEGLKSGQVGLYVKVHHAAIDGQAGVALGRAMFDVQPSGRVIKPPRPKLRRNQYQLGMAELAGAALRNTAAQYVKLVKMLPDMARAAKGLVPPKGADGQRDWGLSRLRDRLAPRTPLNVAITNQRSFAGRTVPVAEVKLIAQRLGVSFNDVVMATTAGGLRSWLQEAGELPARPLTAAVPVSLREAGDTSANNQVSMTLMDLATDIADPAQRLARISAVATQRKAAMARVKGAIPMDFPLFAAPWLVSGLASLYGRSRLANVVPPVANVLISNVAGVPVPLFFAGARVVCYYPVSIPAHGMALNVTVQSYDGRLDYGLIACRRAVPDINELGDHLLAEHRVLLQLAQDKAAAAAVLPAPVGAAPAAKKARRAPARKAVMPPPKRRAKPLSTSHKAAA